MALPDKKLLHRKHQKFPIIKVTKLDAEAHCRKVSLGEFEHNYFSPHFSLISTLELQANISYHEQKECFLPRYECTKLINRFSAHQETINKSTN